MPLCKDDGLPVRQLLKCEVQKQKAFQNSALKREPWEHKHLKLRGSKHRVLKLLRRLWKHIPEGEGRHIKQSLKAPGQLPPLLSPSGRMVRALVVRKSCQLRGYVLGGCVVSWPSLSIPRPPMYSFAGAS